MVLPRRVLTSAEHQHDDGDTTRPPPAMGNGLVIQES